MGIQPGRGGCASSEGYFSEHDLAVARKTPLELPIRGDSIPAREVLTLFHGRFDEGFFALALFNSSCSSWIVEPLDGVEDIRSCFCSCLRLPTVVPLSF
jgi:hypothetical protein